MLKLDVRFVVGGKSYKLKEEVAAKFKRTFLSFALAGAAIFGTAYVYADKQVKPADLEYQEVYISVVDGDASSAFTAIKKLNGEEVDARELLYFFEQANDVDKASTIQAGTYLVPVVSGK